MRFPHLAQHLFNVPLAIRPEKAEVILAALAERLGVGHFTRMDGTEFSPAMLEGMTMDAVDSSQPREPSAYETIGGVAIIPVEGTLVQKLGTLRPWSGMTGYDGIRQNFMVALSDPEVRAILFDIDSPGGECAGCFDLADAIHEARGIKPMWAMLDESAYSAAYALASATDYITIPRTGGTGSIGTLLMHVDFSRALDTAGVTVRFLTYGARKTDAYPELPLAPEAAAILQASIDSTGELFVQTVARNRAISADAVRDLQAASVLPSQAMELGLVDEVMAPDAAFRALLATLGTPSP
jgi:signal peptide peptidase SppA